MQRAPPTISLVVPCYNEQEALPETARQLDALLDRLVSEGRIAVDSSIYCVDDGSRDDTWRVICVLAEANPQRWHGIKLSRNRGHQNALLAGLSIVPGDAVISIDADLQDDIEAIPAMLQQYADGCQIVYGVRDDRQSDSAFKRGTARAYYGMLTLLGVEIVKQHADFRLMSRRAVDALARYSEVNLFLRAIVPLLGYQTGVVTYRRSARMAGQTKYPLHRMISLALEGVTSFSMRPLRLITIAGLAVSIASFLVGFWALGISLFTDYAVPGWTSLLTPLACIGGLQLLALGVIGEYIGKIYLEVKRRPRFAIDQNLK